MSGKVGVRFEENENKEKHSSVKGAQRDLDMAKKYLGRLDGKLQDFSLELRECKAFMLNIAKDIDTYEQSQISETETSS